MKAFIPSLLVIATLCSVQSVCSEELDNLWEGAYTGGDVNLVSIKKLELSKTKEGGLKARAWLIGFPDDVLLGETVAEPYQSARTRGRPNPNDQPRHLLANFSSERIKAVITINPGDWGSKLMKNVYCEAFLKNPDGSKIYLEKTLLGRQP